MKRRTKLILGALLALLAASVWLNFYLYRTAVEHYRQTQEVRLDPANLQRYRQANAELAAPEPGVARVVFVGDSTVERWEPLPDLPGCQMVSRGCGGETTAQLSLRLEQDVLRLKPAVAVLALGYNDLKCLGVFPEREVQIQGDCTDSLLGMAARLRGHGVQVVLLTVFPVGEVGLSRRPVWSDATITAVAEVNRRLRAAAAPGVRVVDCDPVLARAGRLSPDYYAEDNSHVNRAGYEALNRLLRPVVLELVQGARPALLKDER